MKKLFYRLEHKDTRMGIYNCFINISFGTSTNEKHPMPTEDSLLLDNYEKEWPPAEDDDSYISNCNDRFRFGFNSLLQLKNWFYNDWWLKELNDKSIVLRVYEVPYICEGTTQCIIHAEDHIMENLKEEICLLSLIDNKSNENRD